MKLKELFESTGKSIADLGWTYTGTNVKLIYRHLTSLAGAPSQVNGDFNCTYNELETLEGGPNMVNGSFWCFNNRLVTLKGAPSSVGGCFYCDDNQLTSLEGVPSHVGGDFNCQNNELTSLKGIHAQIKEIGGRCLAANNPIKSHVLGLLLIKGITNVSLDNTEVQDILNKHLGKGRAGMLQAQEELIEAGLEEYAKL